MKKQVVLMAVIVSTTLSAVPETDAYQLSRGVTLSAGAVAAVSGGKLAYDWVRAYLRARKAARIDSQQPAMEQMQVGPRSIVARQERIRRHIKAHDLATDHNRWWRRVFLASLLTTLISGASWYHNRPDQPQGPTKDEQIAALEQKLAQIRVQQQNADKAQSDRVKALEEELQFIIDQQKQRAKQRREELSVVPNVATVEISPQQVVPAELTLVTNTEGAISIPAEQDSRVVELEQEICRLKKELIRRPVPLTEPEPELELGTTSVSIPSQPIPVVVRPLPIPLSPPPADRSLESARRRVNVTMSNLHKLGNVTKVLNSAEDAARFLHRGELDSTEYRPELIEQSALWSVLLNEGVVRIHHGDNTRLITGFAFNDRHGKYEATLKDGGSLFFNDDADIRLQLFKTDLPTKRGEELIPTIMEELERRYSPSRSHRTHRRTPRPGRRRPAGG